MITDSYLNKYTNNSEFGNTNISKSSSSNNSGANRYTVASMQNDNSAQQQQQSKQLMDSSMNGGFKLDSLQKSLLDNSRRRYTAEENICEILKGKF